MGSLDREYAAIFQFYSRLAVEDEEGVELGGVDAFNSIVD